MDEEIKAKISHIEKTVDRLEETVGRLGVTVNNLGGTVSELGVTVGKLEDTVDKIEETVDKLAVLVMGGFENINKEFGKVHQEIDQLRDEMHANRLNSASQVELNALKDRVVHLENFVGKKPALA